MLIKEIKCHLHECIMLCWIKLKLDLASKVSCILFPSNHSQPQAFRHGNDYLSCHLATAFQNGSIKPYDSADCLYIPTKLEYAFLDLLLIHSEDIGLKADLNESCKWENGNLHGILFAFLKIKYVKNPLQISTYCSCTCVSADTVASRHNMANTCNTQTQISRSWPKQ